MARFLLLPTDRSARATLPPRPLVGDKRDLQIRERVRLRLRVFLMPSTAHDHTRDRVTPFSSPEPQRFFFNCWTRGSGTIQKYLFFHWLSKTLCAIRLKMLRFCALAFTSGETLEIVLYKGRNNVNIFVDR